MSNGLKLLLIAAGTLITCILCVVSFHLTRQGKQTSNEASGQLKGILTYDQWKEYDGTNCSGRKVIDWIDGCQEEEIYFLVKTSECSASKGVYYNRTEDMEIVGTYEKDKERVSEDYINEYAEFTCTVNANENGIVIGLSFVQR